MAIKAPAVHIMASKIEAVYKIASSGGDYSHLLNNTIDEFVNVKLSIALDKVDPSIEAGAQLALFFSRVVGLLAYFDQYTFGDLFPSVSVSTLPVMETNKDTGVREFKIEIVISDPEFVMKDHPIEAINLIHMVCTMVISSMNGLPESFTDAVSMLYLDYNSPSIYNSSVIMDKFYKMINRKISDYEISISNPNLVYAASFFNPDVKRIADTSEIGQLMAQLMTS